MKQFKKELEIESKEEPRCLYGMCMGSGLIEKNVDGTTWLERCLCVEPLEREY